LVKKVGIDKKAVTQLTWTFAGAWIGLHLSVVPNKTQMKLKTKTYHTVSTFLNSHWESEEYLLMVIPETRLNLIIVNNYNLVFHLELYPKH
jgi:hypothetical protein